MLINRIALRGFTTYKDEQVLDLAALGSGIIAIAGPNGSGKTTLLEAVPGAIYRSTPSRGSIASLAIARDAYIELDGENGSPFRIRLDCDSQTGRQEAMLFDGDGEPLAGPKVKEFDAAIAKIFPPREVYLASYFASQTGVGSVLKMERGDRRALFGRLLGTERLELLATSARERGRGLESEMAGARAALEAVRSGAEDVEVLEHDLAHAREKLTAAEAAELQASAAHMAALNELGRLKDADAEVERARKAAEAARAKAAEAVDEWGRIRTQRIALEPLLARAEEIRKGTEEIERLTFRLDEIRQAGERAAADERQAREAVDLRRQELTTAERALETAERAIADAEAKIKEAAARLDLAEKSTGSVPCAGALDDSARAGCPALRGHFQTRDACRKTIDGLTVAGAGDARRAMLDAAQVRIIKARHEFDQADAERSKASAEGDAYRADYKTIKERVDKLRAADRTAELSRAERSAAELDGRIAAAEAAVNATAKESEQLDAIAAAAPDNTEDLRAADMALGLADDELGKAHQIAQDGRRQVVTLEVRGKAARESQEKAAALVARLAPMDRDLADWRFLARGLGREGVQALELDAAGPRVSGLANELLADAYGDRFNIRFETQAAKADGKGVKETFDVVVVDTERGREGNGEDLSGGEKVIVGEALGLAVGLFHAQAAGVELGTVIRDETVGALDPENGERYLAMLRAFLRVGKVHQLLYVAHNPALVDLADAVVRVDNGRLEVR